MILKFRSATNDVAIGVMYELHEWNDDYYLVKWKIEESNHQRKYLKTKVDEWFDNKEFVAVDEN